MLKNGPQHKTKITTMTRVMYARRSSFFSCGGHLLRHLACLAKIYTYDAAMMPMGMMNPSKKYPITSCDRSMLDALLNCMIFGMTITAAKNHTTAITLNTFLGFAKVLWCSCGENKSSARSMLITVMLIIDASPVKISKHKYTAYA